ncbi:MAG TPA: MarR family winged helix-turn-helix transcriptional regulator [Mycobacteriales bacterium]|nr:MarR family winged helix-turn-helix transcriptional regulator [Mycobacteriales bacterium]
MEPTDLRAAIRALARLTRLLDHTDTGLTLPQYRLLALVDRGDQRSSRLAARLVVTKPTVTALADGLVEAGYLTRIGEPGDGRAVRLGLTDAGRTALHRADTALADRFAPVFSATSDPAALADLLSQAGAALDPATAGRIGAGGPR